jgi:hypothetical protein
MTFNFLTLLRLFQKTDDGYSPNQRKTIAEDIQRRNHRRLVWRTNCKPVFWNFLQYTWKGAFSVGLVLSSYFFSLHLPSIFCFLSSFLCFSLIIPSISFLTLCLSYLISFLLCSFLLTFCCIFRFFLLHPIFIAISTFISLSFASCSF